MTMLSGFSWIAMANIGGRALGLIGQIATGWMLSPTDFGTYAFAASIFSFASAARSGGIAQIAIQRGHDFDQMSGLYFRYAMVFNLAIMAVLLSISALLAEHRFNAAVILAIISVSIPVGTHGTIAKAKLTIDQRFRSLSAINFLAAAVWQGSVIVFAWLGQGPVSFAVAALLQAIFESSAGWYSTRFSISATTGHRKETAPSLLRQGKWVMLGASLLALATTGDYFAVSVMTNPLTSGLYFFAFQLVAALCMPINNSLESVLPTALGRQAKSPACQEKLLGDTLIPLIMISIPFAIAASIMTRPIVHFIWNGKWDSAAGSIAVIMLCIPCWLITTTTRSMLEARGWWQSRFVFLLIYGIGGITSAAVGALTSSDVGTISIFVTAFYALFCLGACYSLKMHGVSLNEVIPVFVRTVIICLTGVLVSESLSHITGFFMKDGGLSAILGALLFLSISLIGNILLMKEQSNRIMSTVRNFIALRKTVTSGA